MNNKLATYATVLFTKQPKKDETYPIKLRVTYERKQKYYGIGISTTKEIWANLDKANPTKEVKKIRAKVLEAESNAKNAIEKMKAKGLGFSFNRFEEFMFEEDKSSDFVFKAYLGQIAALKEAVKVAAAVSTENALNSFKSYFKKDLKFNEITRSVLQKYENWMLEEKKNSITTVSIYLRNLRAMFNRQIAAGLLDLQSYPFGRHKYVIPTVETRYKVIDSEMLGKIYNYKPVEFSNVDKGKDLWFFLYLCNGMNVKDMCRLTFKDFKEDHFIFTRAKTESKTKSKVEIRVVLRPEILKIIEKWGNQNDGKNYVFPFYQDEKMNPVEERRINQNLVSFINDNMNRIAKVLELDINITTYSARQTFSNVLMDSNAPIKLIADTLGHTSTVTTEKHYLKKMQLEKQKEFTKELLNF